MKSCDWIIANDGSRGEKAYMIECLRCGATQPFSTPIPVDYWVSVAKAFEKIHKRCRAKFSKELQVREWPE